MWKIGKIYDPEIVDCSKMPEKDKVIINGSYFGHFANAVAYWPADYKAKEPPKEGDEVIVKGITGGIAFQGTVKNNKIVVMGVEFPIEEDNWIYAKG